MCHDLPEFLRKWLLSVVLRKAGRTAYKEKRAIQYLLNIYLFPHVAKFDLISPVVAVLKFGCEVFVSVFKSGCEVFQENFLSKGTCASLIGFSF